MNFGFTEKEVCDFFINCKLIYLAVKILIKRHLLQHDYTKMIVQNNEVFFENFDDGFIVYLNVLY
jgi:hypothetical protein